MVSQLNQEKEKERPLSKSPTSSSLGASDPNDRVLEGPEITMKKLLPEVKRSGAALLQTLRAFTTFSAAYAEAADQRQAELAYQRQAMRREACLDLHSAWEPTLDELARWYSALCNPVRLRILMYFETEANQATLTELSHHIKLATGQLQHHLQALVLADLLAVDQVDRTRYYELADTVAVRAAFHFLHLTKEMRVVVAERHRKRKQELDAGFAEVEEAYVARGGKLEDLEEADESILDKT